MKPKPKAYIKIIMIKFSSQENPTKSPQILLKVLPKLFPHIPKFSSQKLQSVTPKEEVLNLLHDAEGPRLLPLLFLWCAQNHQSKLSVIHSPGFLLCHYSLTYSLTIFHPILPMVKDILIAMTTADYFTVYYIKVVALIDPHAY